MKKQKFRAKSMTEAVELVKKEMGNDALIISVRQVPVEPAWKVWQSPGFEVVAVGKGNMDKSVQLNSSSENHQGESGKGDNPSAPGRNLSNNNVRSVNLAAFQAALRRTNSEPNEITESPAAPAKKLEAKPKEEAVQSESVQLAAALPDLSKSSKPPTPEKNETPVITAPKPTLSSPAEKQASTPQNGGAVYNNLNLVTPKPKLSLEEFAEALKNSAKPTDGVSEKPPKGQELAALAKVLAKMNLQKAEDEKNNELPVQKAEEATQKSLDETGEESKSGISQPPVPRRRTKLVHRTAPVEDVPLVETPTVAEPLHLPKILSNVQFQLLNQGVDKQIVDKVIKLCIDTLSPGTLTRESVVKEFLYRQMEAHLRVHSSATLATHHTICLVGPSGAGKTSLTAKLAAMMSKVHGLKVTWVCADTVRTGAIAEARVYADLLNVSFKLVYTVEELGEVMQKGGGGAVIVDTPACNPYSETNMVELGALLQAVPHRATYLTTPATAKEIDLMQMLAGFGIFKLDGVVITKMDETRAYGNVFNFAWRSQLPLAYFTSGHRLLEDIQQAEARILVNALFDLQG
ncbi:MAG: hypothetical protein WCI88_02235 [Chloroflexota bacterium]